MKKRLLVLGLLGLLVFGSYNTACAGIEVVSEEKWDINREVELTDENIAVLEKDFAVDLSERDVSEDMIEYLRAYEFAKEELYRKYPSYKLIISRGYPTAEGGNSYPYFLFNIEGAEDDTYYQMNVYTGSNFFFARDNFYSYFVNSKYSELLKNLLTENGVEECVLVNADFCHMGGSEFKEGMEVDKILDGRWQGVLNYTDIVVECSESDFEDVYSRVEELIKEKGLYGYYAVMSVNEYGGKEVSVDSYDEYKELEMCESKLQKLWGNELIYECFRDDFSKIDFAMEVIKEVLKEDVDTIRSIYKTEGGKIALESASKRVYYLEFCFGDICEISDGSGEILYQVVY